MSFAAERYQTLIEATEAWWNHELERPLVHLTVEREPRQADAPPSFSFTAGFDPATVSADQVVAAWDADLACLDFYGDAYPHRFVNFGPGVLAAWCGARLESTDQTVWFHPPTDAPQAIADIDLSFDAGSSWWQRIESITRAAVERWGAQGPVASFTDIGGALDVLSSFRPGERLLMDLYDAPDEVERLIWQIHEAWWDSYDRLYELLQAGPGTTSWAGIFAVGRTYMLQCDFCYMISPEMFDRFVKPELAASCKKLDRSFYHLDGIGQLPHLDSLLEIEDLHGVQWIPGDGQPGGKDWPEVYRRIAAAGKLKQFVCGDLFDFRELVDTLGTAKGFHLNAHVTLDQLDDALRVLESLDVPIHGGVAVP